MQNLLWRLSILLLTVWAIALLATLAITQRQPLPEIESGLQLCDVPCWAGLQPGRTPVGSILNVVQAHMADEPVRILPYERYANYTIEASARHVEGSIAAREGTVSMIRLDVSQPLWQMLLVLNQPRCIEWLDNRPELGAINIFWEQNEVYIMSSLALSHQNPDMRTHTLNIWLPAPGSTLPCDKPGQSRAWPGYAALTRYS